MVRVSVHEMGLGLGLREFMVSDGVRVTGTAYVRVVVRITDSDRGKLTWLGLGLVCVCADVGLGVVVCACARIT